ncbi:hypothetical protein [Mycoplasma leonicaptivi]|uniref:hypothetical protein n=1 Tax=Mycoplasma leonicaptivi TaxID=36742 RepID=UPI0004857DCD|nr:hypothetical protein [Mycoplasma leonicaptivi]
MKKNNNNQTTKNIEKNYTKLVSNIIIENTMDKKEINAYKKNKFIYFIALISILLLITLIVAVILAITTFK